MQLGLCWSLPFSGDLVGRREMSASWEHVEKDGPRCTVMSPTDTELLDLVVEIAATQLRNGRHFVCITPTDSSLNYNRSLKALRSIRGVHTAEADGCAFRCRCVVTEHLVAAGWQFVTTPTTTCEKDGAKVCGRPCSRSANSGSVCGEAL